MTEKVITQAFSGEVQPVDRIQLIPKPKNGHSVVVNDSIETLQKAMNQYIANGWKPIGELFVNRDNDRKTFFLKPV